MCALAGPGAKGGQPLADGGDDIMLSIGRTRYSNAIALYLSPSLSPQPSPVAVFGRGGKPHAIILYFDIHVTVTLTVVWRWWCLINYRD